MSEQLEILEDGHWVPVVTRARTRKGMTRVYRDICRENPKGPPYGMRIVTVHFEHLGRFSKRDEPSLPPPPTP